MVIWLSLRKLILDVRFINLGCPKRVLATRLPDPDFSLPADIEDWDKGVSLSIAYSDQSIKNLNGRKYPTVPSQDLT